MSCSSRIWCGRPGTVAVVRRPRLGKKGTTMELLVLAIVVIVAFGLYRYMRARAAR
jgi:hypothetical protein